jgi:hypothetical protein
MFNFPLYALRQYKSISVEGEYLVILTHKNKYVLDLVDKDELLYSDRRIELLRRKLPYPLYPLKVRVTSLSSLVNGKYRVFLDKFGDLKIWKPKKFYKVECVLIENSWVSEEGNLIIKPKGYPNIFKVGMEHSGSKYVQVVKMSERVCLFFNTTDTRVKDTRKLI